MSEKPDHFIENFTPFGEDDHRVRNYLERLIWGTEPVCPQCFLQFAHYKLSNVHKKFEGLYKCRQCHYRFNIKTGTILDGSHISLYKWLKIISLVLYSPYPISSRYLSKHMQISQKTVSRMIKKIQSFFNC